jgi:hypothetical protein
VVLSRRPLKIADPVGMVILAEISCEAWSARGEGWVVAGINRRGVPPTLTGVGRAWW